MRCDILNTAFMEEKDQVCNDMTEAAPIEEDHKTDSDTFNISLTEGNEEANCDIFNTAFVEEKDPCTKPKKTVTFSKVPVVFYVKNHEREKYIGKHTLTDKIALELNLLKSDMYVHFASQKYTRFHYEGSREQQREMQYYQVIDYHLRHDEKEMAEHILCNLHAYRMEVSYHKT